MNIASTLNGKPRNEGPVFETRMPSPEDALPPEICLEFRIHIPAGAQAQADRLSILARSLSNGLLGFAQSVEKPITFRSPWPEQQVLGPDSCTHTPDFATVRWNGQVYALTPKQRAIVATLWKAAESGTPFVTNSDLLLAADSDAPRVSDLFKRSAAWGTLVVRGTLHGGSAGTLCLPPVQMASNDSPSSPTDTPNHEQVAEGGNVE